MERSRANFVIEHLTKEGLYEKRDELLQVYGEVYAERLSDPFFSVGRYWERLEAYATRDGFSITTGAIDGKLVGYALGFTLPANSGWWTGLTTPAAPGLTDENGKRTFAIAEIMVLAEFRRLGYARQMHDALVQDRPEDRATLLVLPDNTPARSAYLSWGWKKVGEIKPFNDAPTYDSMVLDLSGR